MHYLITFEDYGKEPKHLKVTDTFEQACEFIRQQLDVNALDDSAWYKDERQSEYVIGDAAYVVEWIP